MKTIAVDFDGVIHKYSQGWKDGTIYDDPFPEALSGIKELMNRGYAVFIFSSRSPNDIVHWIQSRTGELNDEPVPYLFKTKKIPFWVKFWDKPYVLGVTNKKLPAYLYIDDRAMVFNSWDQVLRVVPK